MDKTQVGRAGELALTLYGLVTSAGRVNLFAPVADDDHVDLVAGLQGGLPRIAIQVKSTDHLDSDQLVEATASYPRGQVREDRAFLYGVVLLESVSIRTVWLVPSPDFNRLAYRYHSADRQVLEFRASPERDDAFSRFRVDPLRIGDALEAAIEGAPAAPAAWLTDLAAPKRRV